MIIIPSNCASAIPSDPSWPYVSLLVKDIGINGATNNSFYDDGPYKFLPSRNGDVTQGSFSPFGPLSGDAPPQIGGSVYFDGNGDYLTFPSNSAFAFGTGDFTVECWVNIASLNQANGIWQLGTNYFNGLDGPGVYYTTASGWAIYANGSYYSSSVTTPTNSWCHVAFVRSSGTTKLYVNGAVVLTQSDTTNYTGTYLGIGSIYYTQSPNIHIGWISNFRVVKGTAVYTAAFTPPTAPLTAITGTSLLTCQSATAITDASSNAFTVSKFGDARAVSDSPFGWGSVYFDGSGDRITVADDAALNMGTGDFTIELWFNTSVTSFQQLLLKGNDVSGTTIGLGLYNQHVYFDGNTNLEGTSLFALNAWNHCAVSRQSGTTRLYLNGVFQVSMSDSVNYSTATTLAIGDRTANHPLVNYPFAGYISNLRIVKGTALYTSTSAFTPPTAPLTAISGTSLLTCQDKGSIVDASTNSFAVSRVGDSKPVGMTPFAQKQAGYWSNYFDGSGDYLTVPSSASLAFGTGDFTVECWVNPTTWTAGSGSTVIIANPTTNGFLFGKNGSNFVIRAAGVADLVTGTLPTTGLWTHVAAVRSGTTLSLFLNGTRVGTATNSTNFPQYTTYIGDFSDGISSFTGYISNLRVVKGTAVYDPTQATLAVPQAGLSAVAGTSLLTCQDNRFRDNSPNNFAISRYGDTAVSRSNPFGPSLPAPTVNLASAGSLSMPGGSYATVPGGTPFTFAGDFTVECWFNQTASIAYACLWSTVAAYPSTGLRLITNGYGTGLMLGGTGTENVFPPGTETGAPLFNNGQWYHVAVVRSGSTLTMYLNGQNVGSVSGFTRTISSDTFQIGQVSNAYRYNGYISNLRVVNGTAVYTSNFTPPTAPLTAITNTTLLTAQAATTVTDASSNAATVTLGGSAAAVETTPFKRVSTVYGGSAYFDGTGDFLTLCGTSGSSAFTFGTGDFTIECWVNLQTSLAGTNLYLFDMAVPGGVNGTRIQLYSNQIYFTPYSGSGVSASFPSGLTTGTWNHYAMVRSNGVLTGYFNGVAVGSVSNTSAINDTMLTLGGFNSTWSSTPGTSGGLWAGYMSGFRLVKGVAVYTANFTPPTAPVSAVGGTSLLLNFDNGGIYDASGNSNLGITGTPKVSTSVAKYGSGALALDGSATSYLYPTNWKDYSLGTGDFTIEGWVYYPSNGAYFWLYSSVNSSGSNVGGSIYIGGGSGTGTMRYIKSSPYSNTVIGSVTGGNWYHVAVSRSSGVTRMFLNGVKGATDLTDTDAYTVDVAQRPQIGMYGADQGQISLGSIEDLRVTKGIGRYTANFTPPTLEAATQKG